MPHKEIVDKICRGSDCRNGRGYCILSEILKYFGHGEEARIPEGSNCNGGTYDCVLKERIMQTNLSDKVLVQMKCLEMFKYEESKTQQRDIGWNEAFTLWVRNGHAETFARNYQPEEDPKRIYNRTVGRAA